MMTRSSFSKCEISELRLRCSAAHLSNGTNMPGHVNFAPSKLHTVDVVHVVIIAAASARERKCARTSTCHIPHKSALILAVNRIDTYAVFSHNTWKMWQAMRFPCPP